MRAPSRPLRSRWSAWFAAIGTGAIVGIITWIAHAFDPTSARPGATTSAGAGGGGGNRAALVDEALTLPEVPRDAELRALVADAAILAHGAESYEGFCLACHGLPGAFELVSPSNLFDGHWQHGSRPHEIERIIRHGWMPGAMPAWDGMLPDETIAALVAYILSLQPGGAR
jgi:mono/diheme cytochrome c family protein